MKVGTIADLMDWIAIHCKDVPNKVDTQIECCNISSGHQTAAVKSFGFGETAIRRHLGFYLVQNYLNTNNLASANSLGKS